MSKILIVTPVIMALVFVASYFVGDALSRIKYAAFNVLLGEQLKTLRYTFITLKDLRPKSARLTEELIELDDRIVELEVLEAKTRRDMTNLLDEM